MITIFLVEFTSYIGESDNQNEYRLDYDSSDDYYGNYRRTECGCESAIGYDSDGEIRHVCYLERFDHDV